MLSDLLRGEGRRGRPPPGHRAGRLFQSAGRPRREPGARIEGFFRGPGYGIRDGATAAAIGLLARTEAVIADPVYSGKGAAGALAIAERALRPVSFWHTGGYHALFDPAHTAALLAQPQQQSPRQPH